MIVRKGLTDDLQEDGNNQVGKETVANCQREGHSAVLAIIHKTSLGAYQSCLSVKKLRQL
jgi:hypothetical protein